MSGEAGRGGREGRIETTAAAVVELVGEDEDDEDEVEEEDEEEEEDDADNGHKIMFQNDVAGGGADAASKTGVEANPRAAGDDGDDEGGSNSSLSYSPCSSLASLSLLLQHWEVKSDSSSYLPPHAI